MGIHLTKHNYVLNFASQIYDKPLNARERMIQIWPGFYE